MDIPYWDQWDAVCPLLQKLHTGTLALGDLLPFQNEHRIFFPRLFYLALDSITHWNVRIELIAIWALEHLWFNLARRANPRDRQSPDWH